MSVEATLLSLHVERPREGWIEAGRVLRLRERPHAGWTTALQYLSPSWQEKLAAGESKR